MSTLERAIAIAAEAHAGQVDKGGFPYILHPLRVMLAMKSDVGRIVGVLHDVIEDHPAWSPTTLHFEGFSPDVTRALGHLCRPKGISYEIYIDGLLRESSPLARAVKVADLSDNLKYERLNRLSVADCDRLQKRYRPALQRLVASSDLWGI